VVATAVAIWHELFGWVVTVRRRGGGERSAVAPANTGTNDWLSRRAKLGPRNCFFQKTYTPEVKPTDKTVFFWPWCVFSYLAAQCVSDRFGNRAAGLGVNLLQGRRLGSLKPCRRPVLAAENLILVVDMGLLGYIYRHDTAYSAHGSTACRLTAIYTTT
jgi:hypothetical protein